jgi:hypothetical protein
MSQNAAPRIGPFEDVVPQRRIAGLANAAHSRQTDVTQAMSEMINRKGSASG